MSYDRKKKLTNDERAAIRLQAAREFLKCLSPVGEGHEHEKLAAAFSCLLIASGPPFDVACASFAVAATLFVQDEGRRCDVHLLREGAVAIYGGDGSYEVFTEQPDDEILPVPQARMH